MKKNRKIVNIVLFVVMLFAIIAIPTLFKSSMAVADTNVITSAEFVIGMPQYFVNDQVPGTQMDAAPYIDPGSGRTLVPVRYLGDALGATTNWDGTTQTVTVNEGNTTINLVIGSTAMTVNSQAQTLDQAPVIESGRTYLPARWVAQALGYQVSWDATNKIVIIYPENSVGEPAYNNVVTQAQQNAAQPEQVQKLESALGITMTNGGGNWGYEPQLNPDGSPNMTFIDQYAENKESFVVAGYEGATDGDVSVSIECSQMVSNPATINVDISPLQKVLEAFFPGQDSAIQQAMAYAQQCVANTKTTGGVQTEKLPADTTTINGTKVIVAQGDDTTFACVTICGS